ncbi:MAG: thioredoxin family protein [Deltaproteobacteria bacterium]|nr:thioredoxin family protein [Deltaproteobacteria bacterium]
MAHIPCCLLSPIGRWAFAAVRGAGCALGVLAATACLTAPVRAAEPKDPLIAEAVGKRTFVLAEFVSRTCPACQDMRPVVEAVLARHRGVGHQIHDADVEVELSQKYEVKCVPVYVVVDPKGQVRFNDVGTRTEEELDEILRAAGARRR